MADLIINHIKYFALIEIIKARVGGPLVVSTVDDASATAGSTASTRAFARRTIRSA